MLLQQGNFKVPEVWIKGKQWVEGRKNQGNTSSYWFLDNFFKKNSYMDFYEVLEINGFVVKFSKYYLLYRCFGNLSVLPSESHIDFTPRRSVFCK